MLKYHLYDPDSDTAYEFYIHDNQLCIGIDNKNVGLECELRLDPNEAVALRGIITTFCDELDCDE